MSEIGTDQNVDPLAQFWGTLCRVGALKILLFVAIAVNLFHAAAARPRSNQQDFAHYYASSRLWLEGEDVYQTDLATVYENLGWEQLNEEIYQATNPPPLVALFSPFAKMSPQVAHMAWMLVQILSLVAAVVLTWICMRDRLSFDGFAFVLSIFLLLPFVSSHLFYSQVQLLVLAMIMGAYFLTIDSGKRTPGGIRFGGLVACAIVAAAALIKIFPIVLLPWFVWRSHIRFFDRVMAGVVAMAVLLLGVQLMGFGLWSDFVQHGLPTVSMWIEAAYECFTLGNTFHQFAIAFGADPHSGVYVRLGGILGAIILALFYLRLIFNSDRSEGSSHVEFALLLLLMLFCGGTCWWHYLVFLLFPMQVIATQVRERLTASILVFLAVVILLFTNIQPPTTNSGVLNTVLNQRPLIGMVLMASFLGWKLNRITHSGSRNVKMDVPTVTEG